MTLLKRCVKFFNRWFSLLFKLLVIFFAVPVAAPSNVVVENISANALSVSWDRPTEIDINGVLRFYIIEYWIVNQSDTLLTVNVTGDMLDTILNDLDNFTVYRVSVAAFTIGSGPANTSEQRTSENGNIIVESY